MCICTTPEVSHQSGFLLFISKSDTQLVMYLLQLSIVVDTCGMPALPVSLGSNDRNCERNANRDNGNRLFNSQNNAAGAYPVFYLRS